MSAAPYLRLPSGPLSLERVKVMGILNATPDSFYDRGRYRAFDDAMARAHEMAAEGADIIDIGGEKAGPGPAVSVDEEIGRVVPLIERLRRELPVPLSVDTFKPPVARAAVEAGADIINSIGGFGDPEMQKVARETGAVAVIMHIQGLPRVANSTPQYGDVVAEVVHFLEDRARECEAAGIAHDRIVIDPGPGFGKTAEHDIAVMREIGRCTALPYPVLLAASRKTFIGHVLGTSVEDRLEGSLAVTAWGVMYGVKIVRAHDVRATKRVVTMTEAVLHPEWYGAVAE